MMTTTPPACKRGDVVLVVFPNSNLRTAKTRPALVVQRDELSAGLPQIIVCMVTSKVFRSGHPSRVLVTLASSEGANSGLLSDSAAMTDNLATITTSEVERVIGVLPMPLVDAALRYTLSL